MKEKLERLKSPKVSLNSRDYLVYKPLLKDLKFVISNYAKGTVLDIGCGNKPYEDLFENCTSYQGCDIEQSSLEVVDIICQAGFIPVENNSFDTVFCTQVLEHVADHQSVFFEAHRVLKKGGHFIASLPMYWPHHEEPYDFFRFTQHGIKYLLEKYNFEIILIKKNGGKWALVGQAFLLAMDNSNNKTIFSKIKKIVYRLFFIKLIVNSIFSLFEKISKDDNDTLNFVFVGKKL